MYMLLKTTHIVFVPYMERIVPSLSKTDDLTQNAIDMALLLVSV